MQKPFVVCRLFNNEGKSKKGVSAKSKPALAPLSPASEVQVETLIRPLNNQDNLAVDNETLKNNGSCGGSDANGQVSEISKMLFII